jgi:uncharacterized Zn-finger protein
MWSLLLSLSPLQGSHVEMSQHCRLGSSIRIWLLIVGYCIVPTLVVAGLGLIDMHLVKTIPDAEGNERYKCLSCDRMFTSIGSSRRHYKEVHLHLQKDKVECQFCGSKFGRRTNLKRHLAKFHNATFKYHSTVPLVVNDADDEQKI